MVDSTEIDTLSGIVANMYHACTGTDPDDATRARIYSGVDAALALRATHPEVFRAAVMFGRDYFEQYLSQEHKYQSSRVVHQALDEAVDALIYPRRPVDLFASHVAEAISHRYTQFRSREDVQLAIDEVGEAFTKATGYLRERCDAQMDTPTLQNAMDAARDLFRKGPEYLEQLCRKRMDTPDETIGGL